MKRQPRRTRKELVALGKAESIIRELQNKFREIGETIYRSSSFGVLTPLIEDGTLEIKHCDINEGGKVVAEFMLNEVIDALKKSGTKYPVFDELTTSIAHHYSLEKKLQFGGQNPNEIEIGKELILQLPNIDALEISDILRLKGELSEELSRFRGAISDYSRDIESTPFTPETKLEITKQYQNHIKPELDSLRRQVKRNKFIRHFADQALDNSSSHMAQVGIFFCVCSFLDIEKMLSAAGVLTETSYKAFKSRRQSTEEIKTNPLFFYNQLENVKK